jgi:hypothetical protein
VHICADVRTNSGLKRYLFSSPQKEGTNQWSCWFFIKFNEWESKKTHLNFVFEASNGIEVLPEWQTAAERSTGHRWATIVEVFLTGGDKSWIRRIFLFWQLMCFIVHTFVYIKTCVRTVVHVCVCMYRCRRFMCRSFILLQTYRGGSQNREAHPEVGWIKVCFALYTLFSRHVWSCFEDTSALTPSSVLNGT